MIEFIISDTDSTRYRVTCRVDPKGQSAPAWDCVCDNTPCNHIQIARDALHKGVFGVTVHDEAHQCL